MAKAKTERRLSDKEAQAVARTLRVSPQKLNLVAALIRGKKVERALAELEFSRKRIAGTVKKTLESAIANAENNHDLDVDSLIVAEAYVGKSIVMKRFHSRGRGRALGGEIKFTGQATVDKKLLEYRIDIKRHMRSPLPFGIATGSVKADGEVIYVAENLRVGLIPKA